jgi:FkbM family methyltransferase
VTRVVDRWPVRALKRSEALGHLAATLHRARLVDERPRFVARELARGHTEARYGVRGTAVSVFLEHRSPDVLAFDEVFRQRLYEVPEPVERALAELGRAPVVVDLGGNIGLVGAWFRARWPAARIHAVEPEPRNARMLEATIAGNGAKDAWDVVRACAGTAEGTARFETGDYATSHVLADDEEGGVEMPVIDAFSLLAAADLVKIDIEGAEWAILADPRLRDLPAKGIVLEYHAHLCPGDDPHEAAPRLLAGAGFETRSIFEADTGVGMLWAWPRAGSDAR